MNLPKILECTLRDGSYAINFQFTRNDTSNLVRALESVGFDLIEVGHGCGLGASDKGLGVAAASDEDYLSAASEAIRSSKWGVFCIPGIAEIEHLDMAADYGMKFIRIGANVEDYKSMQPFIEKAKNLGFFVCSNFMKSYAVNPEIWSCAAVEAMRYGADVLYVVDSAGGMLPDDLNDYANCVREQASEIRLGFHGHNNMGLGVANALRAYELGFEFIDSSLQGFGRSAGNTSTEQFICAMMRKGVDLGLDPIAVMDVAEKQIQPLIQSRGLSSIDMISGLALFHSSYMPIIKKYATKYRVDPRRLIISVCEHNVDSAPLELVEAQAKKLAENGAKGQWRPLYKHYYGGEQK